MSKFNQLANDFFENLDNVEFNQLEEYVLGMLRQYGFYETAHISFSDGGLPSGNISRQAFYSPDLQAVAVLELSQDWDDSYNYETDSIEWQDFHHYRVYIYDLEEPFDNNSLYFLGDYEKNLVFYYSTNNFDELYGYED